MPQKIIHIFGASGSGTTTLAREISARFGYFHMDTDDYFWLPTNPMFTIKRDKAERLALMKKDIETHEKIVISGSLCDWGDALIPYFDLAIRVVTDTETRLQRLKEREYRRFGERIREGGDMYEEHIKFLKWASEYDNADASMRSKAKHDAWQTHLPCEIIRVNGTESIEKILETLNF
ncbi:MAG: AAA family ATPase [Clostridia bacterium]|nr:AAA family ATPase [Clostridia bacterium]